MNAHSKHDKLAGATCPPRFTLADAGLITPTAFLDAMLGTSDETRAARKLELRRDCIAAIRRGNVRGWPPVMLDECRKIMAAEGLPIITNLGREGVGL